MGRVLEQAMDRTSRYSSPSDLKITDVKCAYSGGGLFVKISTNQDIVGWGEGVDAVGGTYHLVQRMGRSLVGRSPLNPNAIFTQFRSNPFGGPQGGMFVAVQSAFDCALWDLCGKALGVPIYQLMGGKYRDKVEGVLRYTVILRQQSKTRGVCKSCKSCNRQRIYCCKI
jgi:galactonate dehydratase